jgi:hypothetical protein
MDKTRMIKLFNPQKMVATSIIILSFSIIIFAFNTGITGVTKKGNNPGCTCHGSTPSQDVVVTINGPDTLVEGQTANYNVTITGGPLSAAGTDIAVSNGTLTPVSNELQLLNTELTHKSPKASSEGVVTFEFTYTAPLNNVGVQTIFANGNSVNFDNTNQGDKWNFAPNKIIQIMSTTGVEDRMTFLSYRLEQNFPNPFNPSTKIEYSIPKTAFANLKVFDISGRKVRTLVNEEKQAGTYEVNFNAANLASGVYFYRLQIVPSKGSGQGFVQIKKMVLLK